MHGYFSWIPAFAGNDDVEVRTLLREGCFCGNEAVRAIDAVAGMTMLRGIPALCDNRPGPHENDCIRRQCGSRCAVSPNDIVRYSLDSSAFRAGSPGPLSPPLCTDPGKETPVSPRPDLSTSRAARGRMERARGRRIFFESAPSLSSTVPAEIARSIIRTEHAMTRARVLMNRRNSSRSRYTRSASSTCASSLLFASMP